LDALVRLNSTFPCDQWIDAVNGSDAVKSALATPGLKTLLSPSNAALGNATVTDDVVFVNLFNGNLTKATLIELCRIGAQITSVSGEKFDLTCTTTTTADPSSASRSRRVVTTIRISNSVSSTTLTALDIPSDFGTAHGTDAVLMPSDDLNNKPNDTPWYDEPSAAEWGLLAIAVIVLLVALVLVVKRPWQNPQPRHTHRFEDNSGGWPARQGRDDMDDVLAELARVNSGRPTHYYPTPETAVYGGKSHGHRVTGRAQSTHYYPGTRMTDDVEPLRPELNSGSRSKSSNRKNGRGKLSTQQHPSLSKRSRDAQEPPTAGRPGYVDPEPGSVMYTRRDMPVTAIWNNNY
jgi:hypothetical protein